MANKVVTRFTNASHLTRMEFHMLAVPLCRTELYKASFFCFEPSFWNPYVYAVPSYRNFKTQLYEHLLRTYDV